MSVPRSELLTLLKNLRINDESITTASEEAIIQALVNNPNPTAVLMTVYKRMITKEDALKIWEILLNSGINLQRDPQKTKNTLLIDLISYGYNVDAFIIAIEMLILKQGKENVNAKGDHGDTALMRAAANGSEKITRLLLKYDADKNAQNDVGQTAADIALEKKNESVVKAASNEYEAVYQLIKPARC